MHWFLYKKPLWLLISRFKYIVSNVFKQKLSKRNKSKTIWNKRLTQSGLFDQKSMHFHQNKLDSGETIFKFQFFNKSILYLYLNIVMLNIFCKITRRYCFFLKSQFVSNCLILIKCKNLSKHYFRINWTMIKEKD